MYLYIYLTPENGLEFYLCSYHDLQYLRAFLEDMMKDAISSLKGEFKNIATIVKTKPFHVFQSFSIVKSISGPDGPTPTFELRL